MSVVAAPVEAPARPLTDDGAPPVVAPPPGHPRFPLVDPLRAIAVLLVIAVHSGEFTATDWHGLLAHAEVGVTVFFVISGFLLYRPYVSARLNGAPETRLRDFFRRRLLRILPAYWLALTVLAIWPGVPGVFSGHFWAYYGLLQNYNDNWVLNGIPQAWTLSIELSFYLLLPVYAVLMTRALGHLRRERQVIVELLILGLLAAGSLAYRWVLRSDVSLSPVVNTLPTHLDWFAPGLALAVLSAHWQSRPLPRPVAFVAARPYITVGVAGLAYVLVSLKVGLSVVRLGSHIIEVYTPAHDLARHVLYAIVAVGLMVPAVFGSGGLIRRVMGLRVLAWLGLISYGIYLWHEPLMRWVCQPASPSGCQFRGVGALGHQPLVSLAVLSLAFTVVCAALSYYLVERPILRFKHLRSSRPGQAAIST